MSLGERIALARKQAGLSQEQLGEKLGVSRQAVSKWESGQTDPSVAYLAQMCRTLGISSDHLLLGEPSGTDPLPARCPSCGGIVTGLEKFCPNCGYALQERPVADLKAGRYTLVLTNISELYFTAERLGQLYRELPLKDQWWIPAELDVSDGSQGPQEHLIRNMLRQCPVTVCGNVDYDTALRAKHLLGQGACLNAYPAEYGEDAAQLIQRPPIQALSSSDVTAQDHMTFGTTVLAVILGVVGAILLLSFL